MHWRIRSWEWMRIYKPQCCVCGSINHRVVYEDIWTTVSFTVVYEDIRTTVSLPGVLFFSFTPPPLRQNRLGRALLCPIIVPCNPHDLVPKVFNSSLCACHVCIMSNRSDPWRAPFSSVFLQSRSTPLIHDPGADLHPPPPGVSSSSSSSSSR